MMENFQNINRHKGTPENSVLNEQEIESLKNKSRERFTDTKEQMRKQIEESKKRVGEDIIAPFTYLTERIKLLDSDRFSGFFEEVGDLKTKIEGRIKN